MGRLARLLLVVAVTWCLGAAAAEAQRAPVMRAYLDVAASYRAGTLRGEPVSKLRHWPLLEVENAVKALARSAPRISEPPLPGAGSAWIDARVAEAAVMMHAEAALLALAERSSVEAQVHAEAAGTLLEAIQAEAAARRRKARLEQSAPPPLRPRLDRGRFYAALAEGCHSVGDPWLADEIATRGLRAEPTDARLLHVGGCVKETLMVLRGVERKPGEAEEARRAAEKLLRDTLAVAPDNPDARLRLARVLVDQDRLVEAQPLLEAVTRADDSSLRYLGWLFLGRLHHRRQAWNEAADAYAQAMREQPQNQAARFGLAALLEQQSGPAAARPLLLTTLSLSEHADRQGDPWWSYPLGPLGMAAGLLDELTKQVRAP